MAAAEPDKGPTRTEIRRTHCIHSTDKDRTLFSRTSIQDTPPPSLAPIGFSQKQQIKETICNELKGRLERLRGEPCVDSPELEEWIEVLAFKERQGEKDALNSIELTSYMPRIKDVARINGLFILKLASTVSGVIDKQLYTHLETKISKIIVAGEKDNKIVDVDSLIRIAVCIKEGTYAPEFRSIIKTALDAAIIPSDLSEWKILNDPSVKFNPNAADCVGILEKKITEKNKWRVRKLYDKGIAVATDCNNVIESLIPIAKTVQTLVITIFFPYIYWSYSSIVTNYLERMGNQTAVKG